MTNNEEIVSIFKEMARNEFNEQEQKYSRKRKYEGLYCCSEDEVNEVIEIFESLLEDREQLNQEYFDGLFTQSEPEEE